MQVQAVPPPHRSVLPGSAAASESALPNQRFKPTATKSRGVGLTWALGVTAAEHCPGEFAGL